MRAALCSLVAIAEAKFVLPLNVIEQAIEESTQFSGPSVSSLTDIDTDRLQSLITTEALEARAEELFLAANASTETYGHPTRAIGSPGHNATLEYIYDTLDNLSDYYDISTQPFVAMGSKLHSWQLSLSGSYSLESRPLQMSPSANVTGARVLSVPGFGCLPSDFEGSAGKVVIVKRGECAFGDKSEYAGQAGAVGVLLWDPTQDDSSAVFQGGDLGTPLGNQVATLGVSSETVTLLNDGGSVDLFVDSEVQTIETVNVIAETRGGDHDNVVFLGAHSDSVSVGPGLNDNGSGLITLLEIAKQLTHFKVNNAVRFAWWSAEELGLKGSLYYTQNLPKREAQKIRLFLDYDMLASPNYVYEVYDSDDKENPEGSGALRDMFEDWFKSHGFNYTLQPFDGRSDYVGFIELGIPASGIDAGAEELKTKQEVEQFGGEEGKQFDECYHQACDGLDNLNYDAWIVNTKLVAHSAAVYAKSLESFPKRVDSFYGQRDPFRRWTGHTFM